MTLFLVRLGIKSGVGLFACCVLFTGAGIARWWDNDKEADDTRALAAWLAAPAITVPTDIVLPDAHVAPLLRRPLLLRPTTWDVLSERDRDLVEVPWTVPLTKWNGHTTEVRIQTQPLAPELYVSNRSVRLPIAELAIDLPSPCSHHCLDDAMTKVRLALAWAGGELRALPLLRDDGDHGTLSVVVVADRSTHFGLLARLTHAIDRAGWGSVVFAAKIGPDLVGIETSSLVLWGEGHGEPELELDVRVVATGFDVGAHGLTLNQGCTAVGNGTTVPNKPDGTRDFVGLRRCLLALRQAAGPGTWAITADGDTDYQTVMSVMNTVAVQDNREPLFPDFALGLRVVHCAWEGHFSVRCVPDDVETDDAF